MPDLSANQLAGMRTILDGALQDSNESAQSPFTLGECSALVDMAVRCVAAEQALALAVEALDWVEWSGVHPDGSRMCPECCGDPVGGHFERCKLWAALAAGPLT